ncbi:MAG: alpha-N-arabinofuranosidase [Clostridia bacterium]|nr:alpha-N-arabinofuranosidase [Clostridia bacterium]
MKDTLYINPNVEKGHIRRQLQGHFSEHLGRCIYGGLFVGDDKEIPNVNGMRTDVVEALKKVRIPALRWPGGCFADEYHWKDGIGPKENRKKMINTHWGGVTEDNSFGTHEFMELCRQLECDAYITGNVGSGTVQEMNEWVEYLTFDGVSPMAELRKKNGHEAAWRVQYFGVGNEPWGCGGNMTAEYYANEYRRYQTYIRQYRPDARIYRVAAGPNAGDFHWTEVLMREAVRHMDGLSLHYYTVPHEWHKKGSALNFTKEDYYLTLEKTMYMEELLKTHGAIMDQYDPNKRVGLIVDEWGTWYDVEEGTNPGFLYQQNSMRDAIVAGLNLNMFNEHCDRVHMANIAQTVNVLQAMILTEGKRMLCTPTYYAFKLFSAHQENELVDSHMLTNPLFEGGKLPAAQATASKAKDGTLHVTLVNPSADDEREVKVVLQDFSAKKVTGEVLTGKMGDHNTFDEPERVKDRPFTGFALADEGLTATLPACSVVHLAIC